MRSMTPTKHDLLAVAAFADRFDAPDFVVGRDVPGSVDEDGVVHIGWWEHSPTVSGWAQALYEHHVINPQSDYLSGPNRALTHQGYRRRPGLG